MARQLRNGTGELDAGRTAADNHERQQTPLVRGIALQLGPFERDEHTAPNRQRIVQGFQSGRPLAPLVVTEIGVRGARGHDQVVVPRCCLGSESSTTCRPLVSISLTSASSTRTFRWRLRIHRIGDAISPGDSAAVAT